MKLPFFKKKKSVQTQFEANSPSGLDSKQAITKLTKGITSIKDIIAPSAIEVDFNHLKINDTYFRTLFVAGYPRFVSPNWLAPLITFERSLDVAMFIYPIEGKGILDELRRKIGEMEAEIQTDVQRGKIPNVHTKISLEDARKLQEQLAKGAERFFQFGLYITIPSESTEGLKTISQEVEATMASLMIVAKPATLQMEDAFLTTLPVCHDKLMITRNMDTTCLATTFPFASSELSANKGILYGINEHNGSLIIFDRFSMENSNLCLFGKAGSGKSFCVKTEILRSLMFGTEIIVVDPENEYETLSKAVEGAYIDFSFRSQAKINPFDLGQIKEEENPLAQKILSLHALLKIIMGKINPDEEASLDRALVLTYKQKGITQDPTTHKKEPPLMEDLYKALMGMEEKEAKTLANRLERYVKGSLAGIFNQKSNVEFTNPFTVFGIKNLETELRPAAMFIVLDFIWNKIKSEMKKRILVVDEAWYLMRHEDSATFLYSLAKRARKYYLGLTTITQDVEDFLESKYGKAIINNSSIQILMKQSPAAIDKIGNVFYLSEGEKNLLLSANIGQGLFFAGQSHVAIHVVASEEEHKLITTKPAELIAMKKKTVAEMKKKEEIPPPIKEIKPINEKPVIVKEEINLSHHPDGPVDQKDPNQNQENNPEEKNPAPKIPLPPEPDKRFSGRQ